MRSGMARLLDNAACEGVDPSIIFSTDYEDHEAVVRGCCSSCPVVMECIQVVRPRLSYFDGTCGGRYWLNGVDMSVRISSRHFSPYTVYVHRDAAVRVVMKALTGRLSPGELTPDELMLFVHTAHEAGIPLTAVASLIGFSYQLTRTMPPVVRRDAPEWVLQGCRAWPVLLDASFRPDATSAAGPLAEAAAQPC